MTENRELKIRMTEIDFDSDAFLVLLTDALRAGPGSPHWHEAVRKLRAEGIEHSDEYRLLVVAREHLESGKEYRSIRAGPEFSKRLMLSIEDEASRRVQRPATSTSIAIVSAGVMLVALLIIGYLLWNAADRSRTEGEGTTLLTESITSIGSTAVMPADWRAVGRLDIQLTKNSIKPAPTSMPAASGGALTWQRGIDPGEPFMVVAGLRVLHAEEDLIAEVFVTDSPDFSEDNATTSHELIWLLRSNRAQVILPGGHLQAQGDLPAGLKDTFWVRLTIERGNATVDMAGKRLWSGSNGLDPERPRYIGIRFLSRSNAAADGIAFQVVRVNMRQK